MDGIQLTHFPILLTCYLVAMYIVQATDYVSLINELMQTKTQSGSGKTRAPDGVIASSISDKEVHQTTMQSATISWKTRIRMDSSSSSPLITISHLAHVASNTIHHPSSNTNSSSDITRFKPVATPPCKFLSSNRTINETTSEMLEPTDQLFTALPTIISEGLTPNHTTQAPDDLYNTPDDTLVISGGLYDAPQTYNPDMTAPENEVQTDYLPFESTCGQYKLEYLPVQTEKGLFSTFKTFQLPQDSQ
ncbi:uncharacterized protein [Apteryx mantelli]|uniref:Uncharacterized protein n=1 Tax=Apteryx mantelli TaxID=2696672 RepID=A0A8B7IJF9_9AVES|nr:PREDICTED: uncharacterized protein LOC106485274 [Apteryx mantelli mantelli]